MRLESGSAIYILAIYIFLQLLVLCWI